MQVSNYEGVSHRDDRLRKCAKIAAAIMSLSVDQLSTLVAGLHDHRGSLTVTWFHEPTPSGKHAWQTAWNVCGEPFVNHRVGAV